ncbi:MAG: DUF1768 domain-containing protein [Xanthomonadales bacterium]|nr:DUF1768 domain-containing protein [Xanthomonadales bacterium]
MFDLTVSNGRQLRQMDETHVYIGHAHAKWPGKSSALSNPFYIADMTRQQKVDAYADWLWRKLFVERAMSPQVMTFRGLLERLRANQPTKLLCWCSPSACHGDVIKIYLEAILRGQVPPCPFARGPIERFAHEFAFLSNFEPVTTRGQTAEHQYQAAKVQPGLGEDLLHAKIMLAGTAGQAKRLGRTVTLAADWNQRRVSVMLNVLRWKFDQRPDLAERLIATAPADLIEGNDHGDVFWGVCRTQGENQLGQLLMQVRTEYQLRRFEPVDLSGE